MSTAEPMVVDQLSKSSGSDVRPSRPTLLRIKSKPKSSDNNRSGESPSGEPSRSPLQPTMIDSGTPSSVHRSTEHLNEREPPAAMRQPETEPADPRKWYQSAWPRFKKHRALFLEHPWPYIKGGIALTGVLIAIAGGIVAIFITIMGHLVQEETLEIGRRTETLAEWNARKDYRLACFKSKDEGIPLDDACIKTFQSGWLGPPPLKKGDSNPTLGKRDPESERQDRGSWPSSLIVPWDILFVSLPLFVLRAIARCFIPLYVAIGNDESLFWDRVASTFGLSEEQTQHLFRRTRWLFIASIPLTWIFLDKHVGELQATEAVICLLGYTPSRFPLCSAVVACCLVSVQFVLFCKTEILETWDLQVAELIHLLRANDHALRK